MPKKGRGKSAKLDPLSIPVELQTALEALYGHYEKTYALWEKEGIDVPPCFIVVCNNTSTSKLVYDYISGFQRENDDGSTTLENGRLALFRNFDEYGNPLASPRTLLIDSEQLESGESLDDNFRNAAADEIDRFRREIVERTGDRRQADNISDEDLLREVMNTVGKRGRLGGSIRCVVAAARDGPGEGDHARARRLRDPLPARRGLPRRAPGGAPFGRIRRRLDARAHPGSGGSLGHAQRGHHRRGCRSHSRSHGRPASLHAALPSDAAAPLHQVARPWRGAEAAPVRPAQAHHPRVARRPSDLQGPDVPRSAHVSDAR